jgi:hypothetical protein
MLMCVGLWTSKGDLSKARKRIACAENVPVVSSLAQMQHEIDQIAQPILVRGHSSEAVQPALMPGGTVKSQ